MTPPGLDCGPHIVNHLKERIDSLKTALELAQQRIDELEECLGASDDLRPLQELGLSPQEARVVNLLMRRDRVTGAQLREAIYVDDPERKYDVVPNTAHVVLSKARKKLAGFGVQIERGRPGRGGSDVCMLPNHKTALHKLLTGGIQIPHTAAAA